MSETLARYACSLDRGALAAQMERYARLATSVARIDRAPRRIRVEFGPDVDRELLESTLAIERECCPFFEIGFDAAPGVLEVRVGDSRLAPALAAIADQLSPSEDPAALS